MCGQYAGKRKKSVKYLQLKHPGKSNTNNKYSVLYQSVGSYIAGGKCSMKDSFLTVKHLSVLCKWTKEPFTNGQRYFQAILNIVRMCALSVKHFS